MITFDSDMLIRERTRRNYVMICCPSFYGPPMKSLNEIDAPAFAHALLIEERLCKDEG